MADYCGWHEVGTFNTKKFTCGHCGEPVASERGYYHDNGSKVYICHFCWKTTFFGTDGEQVPGKIFGDAVNDVKDPKILGLYNEARRCASCNAFTGAVLCCRKLLMNIAVNKGAAEGLKFIDYVEYLASKNYIPPDGEEWVDHIRTKGNEATHEITIMVKEDAEDLITFAEMLLKFIYEFPEKIKKKKLNK
jgi:Domain of unknown function (DUF4145)